MNIGEREGRRIVEFESLPETEPIREPVAPTPAPVPQEEPVGV